MWNENFLKKLNNYFYIKNGIVFINKCINVVCGLLVMIIYFICGYFVLILYLYICLVNICFLKIILDISMFWLYYL